MAEDSLCADSAHLLPDGGTRAGPGKPGEPGRAGQEQLLPRLPCAAPRGSAAALGPCAGASQFHTVLHTPGALLDSRTGRAGTLCRYIPVPQPCTHPQSAELPAWISIYMLLLKTITWVLSLLHLQMPVNSACSTQTHSSSM